MANQEKMSTGQMAELLAIDKRNGLHDQVQALINRLNGNCGPDEVRRAQAKVLWDLGWGWGVNGDFCPSFEAYLKDIPHLPTFPVEYLPRFDRVRLVDTRLPLADACRLAGISFCECDVDTFVPFYPSAIPSEPIYWMSCEVDHCVSTVQTWRSIKPLSVTGLSIVEGIALYVQDRGRLFNQLIALPGSVHGQIAGNVAQLDAYHRNPKISHWTEADGEELDGIASRQMFVGT